GCFRFDAGVFRETRAGLLRFWQPELRSADDRNAESFDQGTNFRDFPGIVAGNDQTITGLETDQSFSASFWAATSDNTPRRASASSSANCVSLKGTPSAVPWTSTNPPLPVSTKLASVSAVESSA